jgi:hypothetical protein
MRSISAFLLCSARAISFAGAIGLITAASGCGGSSRPAAAPLSGTVDEPFLPPVAQTSEGGEGCTNRGNCASPPPLITAAPASAAPVAPAAPAAAPALTDETVASTPTLDPDQVMPKNSVSTNATLQLDQMASAMIDARSDLYSSSEPTADGRRGGVLPATITLAAGGGYVVFSGVHGRIGCEHSSHWGPDGGTCAGGHTRLNAADSVSGIVAADRTLFLVGVFLSDTPGPAPAGLDFSPRALGTSRHQYEPQLGQSFFIGDGLTETGSGAQQHFVIPAGATKLYLGIADGFGFQGNPAAYGDNTGSIAVGIAQKK